MATQKRIGKLLIVLITVAVVQFLFDPLSRLANLGENVEARIGVPMARAKWEAQHIAYYSFEVRGFDQICIPDAKVEVRNEKVVQVNLKDWEASEKVSETPLLPGRWSNPYWPDVFYCDYANFTIPRFFDLAEQELRFVSRISFDSTYGFISQARFGRPSGRGLLSPGISDCCTYFVIENFQVLEPAQP